MIGRVAILCRIVLVVCIVFRSSSAAAVTSCKVKVNSKTGVLSVSASGISGALKWGDRPGGPYASTFANAATCVTGAAASNCQLGAPGTAEAMTPPDLCTFYLKDDGAECAAHVKGCTPGVRPTDTAKADALKQLVNALSFHHSVPTMELSGVNLQIDSGTGRTDGPVNGAGNLIIGYNELGVCDYEGNTCSVDSDCAPQQGCYLANGLRDGSHNLIIGAANDYRSYGGIVAGAKNTIRSPFGAVTGGEDNIVDGLRASVSGGRFGYVSGQSASVSGGLENYATADEASVSGGSANRAAATASSVSGGLGNRASGDSSSISGGFLNSAIGSFASVSGGSNNNAAGTVASVSGGDHNVASCQSDPDLGTCPQQAAWIGGGQYNLADGAMASVSGGDRNRADGDKSSVTGGALNIASGTQASVSGGIQNLAGVGSTSTYTSPLADGQVTSICGGNGNHVLGATSAVGGGTVPIVTGANEWHGGRTGGFPTSTLY